MKKRKITFWSCRSRLELMFKIQEDIKEKDLISISSIGDEHNQYYTVWYYKVFVVNKK